MHTVFALLCLVVVIHWLIFPYPSGLLHWHCGNLTIAPVPAKQPWWIWINTSCEFIMNDCITTTKQSTAKPCGYFLGYTVYPIGYRAIIASVLRKQRWRFVQMNHTYVQTVDSMIQINKIKAQLCIHSSSQELCTRFGLCCALLCFLMVWHGTSYPYPSQLFTGNYHTVDQYQ